MKQIELSVHELVDFVLRSGNIDSRSFNSMTMQEGTKIHNIYQSKQGPNYIKEYPLKGVFSYEDYLIHLSGRSDGIILEDVPIIEEIKSTNSNLQSFFEENEKWHLGQAICYAYLYLLEKNLNEIKIRLTYISQVDNDVLKKDYFFTKEELFKNIYNYFNVYFQFARILDKRVEKRNESLTDLSFPFEETREGQEDLIKFTKEAIKKSECYFAEASTGIGKTMATIYSTLPSFYENKIDKVFYLCPKNTNFDNCSKALEILSNHGYKLSFVEIKAKSKMCPYKLEKACNPDDCPLTIGYYSKLKEALADCLIHEDLLTSEIVDKYAAKYEICPFEFSLDLSLYVDFIICDYNYAFHPIAYLRRFFEAPDKEYRLFALVDEAHNLIDRARDMFTVTFSEKMYSDYKKELKGFKNKEISKILRKLNQDIKLFKEFEFGEKPIILEKLDEQFVLHLTKLRSETNNLEADNPKLKFKKGKDFLVDLYKFIVVYDLINEGFKIILDNKNNNLTIKLFCIDPSSFINKSLFHFLGTLFFSATLTPINYFEKVTLNNDEYKTISIPSPFNENNFKLIINDKISIKYKDRDKTLEEVCKEIDIFVSSKIGNYLVFVPSFEYSSKLEKMLLNDERYIFQRASMTNKDKDEFLTNFIENPLKTKVGVCVISGSFAESIDLVGDRLIGVVVVGVGLPQINFENNLVKEFYIQKEMDGYQFAYMNPGINKVLQALGRVIRTKDDRGAALIIDSRYSQSYYKNILLARYKNYVEISDSRELIETLNSFYKN